MRTPRTRHLQTALRGAVTMATSLSAIGLALILPLAPASHAQELRVHPTPFSVMLDLHPEPGQRTGLPLWMEAVQQIPELAPDGSPQKTRFRLRLLRMPDLNPEVQLRLFFDDVAEGALVVTGWTETGQEVYRSKPIGAGLRLPSSETLFIPVAGTDYLDIETPGDGSSVRGAFVSTLRRFEGRHALDFDPESVFSDPFQNRAGRTPSENDSFLFGRVRATIDAAMAPLTPQAPQAVFEFDLEKPPKLAVLHFEVLQLSPLSPPILAVNQNKLPNPGMQLPDLADPGYQGSPHFQYSGWIHCQAPVLGSALRPGRNQILVELPKGAASLVIRSLEMDLKYSDAPLRYPRIP